MTREDSIRKEALFHLWAVKFRPVLAENIAAEARKKMLDYTRSEVKQALQFLTDEGLVTPIEMKDSSEILYRINSTGAKFYEQNYAE